MQALFQQYNLELDENQSKLFEKFLKLFVEKNAQINLSAIREESAIIEKHFIDSIMLKKFASLEGNILDLWTGWGFPGIPLKITDHGNTQFTLVDSIGKKVKVVNEFIEALGLSHITAIQARAETLGHDKAHREKYNMVVSRATAYLPTLLEYVMPLLSLWGIFVAYKLDDEAEIIASNKALHILDAEVIAIKKYEIWGQKRMLVFIQKMAPTHKKYPRPIWEPLKNPLW